MRALLIMITLLASGVAGQMVWAQGAPVRIGVQNERPPFSFTDDEGELRGFDVEIAEALCATMEAQCELVSLDFVQVIPALQEGRIDAAVASMSITDGRRELVDFTDKYYQAANRFVARSGTVSDVSPEALAGKVVGVKRGTTHDRYLSEHLWERGLDPPLQQFGRG